MTDGLTERDIASDDDHTTHGRTARSDTLLSLLSCPVSRLPASLVVQTRYQLTDIQMCRAVA